MAKNRKIPFGYMMQPWTSYVKIPTAAPITKMQIISNIRIRFISLAKKYTTLTELTQEVLHTFVSRIEVHERTIDSFGKEHQDIDIYFTHIGAVK